MIEHASALNALNAADGAVVPMSVRDGGGGYLA